MTKKYDAKSIEHLTFREGARLRVGVYLGSADNEGVLNGLLEIVNNSTDEANAGFGKTIEIGVTKKTAYVRDYGRGLPRGKTDKSEEIMVTLLTENHSGAKFGKDAYAGFSRGLNGTGGGATCVTSDWMEVTSWRDGYKWEMRFENGIPTTKTAQQGPATKETGTLIHWQPSQQVFSTEEIYFDYEKICQVIEEYSYFNVGTKFICKNLDTKKTQTFLSKNGLVDFAENKIINALHKTPIYHKIIQDGIEIEIIAKWTSEREKYFLFVNGAECPEGGTPLVGARTSITRTVNNLTKDKFDGYTVRKGLIYIIAIKHPNPIFANQTKTKVSNAELRGLADLAFREGITTFSLQNRGEFEKIVVLLNKEQKAEIAAERARNAVLSANKDITTRSSKKVFATDKLKDAEVLGQESTLILCEGDSALGALAQARDTKKYGLLALRGKTINPLTNEIEKVMANEEVRLIFSALGVSLNNYNPRKLRYGKIAIASDQDSDGNHIFLLILTLFQQLAPQILEEGRVYRLESPLYVIHSPRKNHYYYSIEEVAKSKATGSRTLIKGLGELSALQMKESMFGETQRLTNVKWTKDLDTILINFMGKEVQPRKDFLFANADFSKIQE